MSARLHIIARDLLGALACSLAVVLALVGEAAGSPRAGLHWAVLLVGAPMAVGMIAGAMRAAGRG